MTTITEADVEQAALAGVSGLAWQLAHGPDIAAGDLRRGARRPAAEAGVGGGGGMRLPGPIC